MVKVLLDGVSIGNVALGGSRPDVATAYNRPDFTNSGWSFTGSVRTASVGAHTLTAVGYDSSGNAGQIATSIPITVTADNDSFLGSLDSAVSTSNPNTNSISMGDSITVQGWAAEPDASPGAPLSRVEIEIDGQLLGVATLGISRPDVATAYNRSDYTNSGWSFTGPVSNVDPGEHSIGVRVYTKSGGSFLLPLLRQIIVAGTMPTISGGVTPAKYAFSVGYAPNGNVVQAGDTVNGDWSYTYDTLNRLVAALSPTTGVSWTYDAFGNRWQQTATRGSAPQPQLTFFTATNRLDMECYDASGDVLDDGPCPQNTGHKYSYDGEGRLTSSNFGETTYIYDAEGNRVAKESGSTITNVYLYDTDGHTVAETDGSLNPLRTEIYAGSRHLATYQNGSFYYNHLNWLGTEAARSDSNGNLCETLSSLPFGDALQTSGTCSPTPNFFTGKERDAETGNDYFGARYYNSTFGRFFSPDWSAKEDPVPYAKLEDPQTLNLYAYVGNNPMSGVDPDGHFGTINGGTAALCEANAAGSGCAKDKNDTYQQFAPDQAQVAQQQSAPKTSFWHGVNNLFHLHSWNYVEAKVEAYQDDSKGHVVGAENPIITAVTDAAGMAASAFKIPKVGPASAVVNYVNDPSPQSFVTNGLGLIPGLDWPVGITGAYKDFFDYGIHNSHPGPQKVGDPPGPNQLQPALPTQDGGCLAAGSDFPC